MIEPGAALNPAAWVDNYGDYLFRYAVSRLRNQESAEEVVQDAFVAALRARDQYSGRGAERAWLLGILKRKIIDYVRKRHREVVDSDLGDDRDIIEQLFDSRGKWRSDPRIFGKAPDAAMESEEFWQVLDGCLDGLPEKQRNVFALREIEGASSDSVRKELGISSSNLWVLLHRARLRLADCIKVKWQNVEVSR